jgi:glycosyltransferase involved in cell wall biosynthesis
MTEPSPTVPAIASSSWQAGKVPVAVVMISLNEAHNMAEVLENLKGFAQEVFLVDSYSSDETVDIALSFGVQVVQRRFRGFGDQGNFAMRELPMTAPWTMKLDPDERLSDDLKQSIRKIILGGGADGFTLRRRLWFMGKPLPIKQIILRGWRTGTCRFSDVLVNEHPLIEGRIVEATGDLEHHDSPDLHHWFDKQNRYTTQEALIRFRKMPMAAHPKLFGSKLERRIWLKKYFFIIPFRYKLYFIINIFLVKTWRTGRIGFTWARLRVWVRRSIEDKLAEMNNTGQEMILPVRELGKPHPSVRQMD